MNNKTCSRCHITYPASDIFFRKNPGGKHGLSSWCKTCQKAYDAGYKKSKSPELLEYCKLYRKNHPEWAKEVKRNSYLRHREHVKEKSRSYRKEHPEKCRVSKERNAEKHSRRRCRKLAVGGAFTESDVLSQFERQGGVCFYCGCALENYHVDHFVPLSKGGSNRPDNIVVSCPGCNLSKSDRMPDVFIKELNDAKACRP